jgi:hypothetical protein
MPDDPVSKLIGEYLKDLTAQTRGSHRVKSANRHGTFLARLLNIMSRTVAEQAIAGYIERAQIRLRIATQQTGEIQDDVRALLFICLTERLAFDTLLKLDQYDALGSINRICRCARCTSWFWARVKGQRYCSEGCRVRHYQSSPEGKKYKREWARNEYQRNKRRDDEARHFSRKSLSLH